jgi:uracil-DNA glycosylase family 4
MVRVTYNKEYARDELGADCNNCPLRVGGRFVPSAGPAHADVAFVGEAPGAWEAREGIPFIGPSGRLLTIVQKQYGIKRDEVFLSNACLCRPADGSTPTKAAIGACRPRLLNELEQSGASTVVALGNSAALAILGIEGVTKLRVGPGRTSPYESLAGVRVIPTVHPAACLRQSDMFPSLVADVGKVVTDNVTWNPPNIVVHDDPVDAISYLNGVRGREGALVVDIEVDIEKDTAFGHPNQYGLLCVGLAESADEAHVIGEHACADDAVRDAMADALGARQLVAHNGKFDLAGLYPVLGATTLFFDTMLASYVLDERPGVHGLKYLAVEFLGAPQYDLEIKKYVGPRDGYGVIPRDKLYTYNGYDASCTYSLYELFRKRLDRQALRTLHDFLVDASNELMYLELNGLPVDRGYADTLADKYLASLDGIETEINHALTEAGYVTINPRSPMQVKAALLHWRISVDSTNEDTLKLLRTKAKPGSNLDLFLEALLRHRREAKLYGTYVKGIVKRLYRGRVYSSYSLHGTTTGRLSSRNPNLQNIPRESSIKQLFVPGRPENVFVQADYSQAELRVVSFLAGDSYFRDILNDPTRDIFDELTPQLRPDLPPKEEVDYEEWKDIRVRIKAFVYGLNYGRKWFSIAQEYDMDPAVARAMTARFFETIPDIAEWQKDVKRRVYDGEDLITPFGRHRRFHLITEDNWDAIQNEALAFLPQSTSSDVCLRAMVRVRRDLRGSGAFIRNIVHDSILVDCPADMASDVSVLLDRRMVESGQELVGDYITFRTDVKVGKHWGEV